MCSRLQKTVKDYIGYIVRTFFIHLTWANVSFWTAKIPGTANCLTKKKDIDNRVGIGKNGYPGTTCLQGMTKIVIQEKLYRKRFYDRLEVLIQGYILTTETLRQKHFKNRCLDTKKTSLRIGFERRSRPGYHDNRRQNDRNLHIR